MALDLSAEGLKAFLFETLPYQIHVCLAFDWPDFAEPVFYQQLRSMGQKSPTHFFLPRL
jgi:hypothetical protein